MTMAKTEAGLKVLKDRRSGLSPRQRAALILIDGQRSLEEVLKATSAGGITRGDIDRLLELGLITEQFLPSRPVQPPSPDFTDSSMAGWDQYVRAYGIATELAAQLGRKDLQLALAIEAAGTLAELDALAPQLLQAVGPVKFARLEAALRMR
ncbi:hypothetical protein [Ramlibacter alkalitolerans]|uniref:Uncharacterized protein n=1 Tax=Ramlibacter alkalitolerans TaxID=2039631 RepID=A0ABS1JUW7_9BURK|nr:hypothetical protein [Ramlibacter alkalitolerans]MBL0428049.1 hypothetical protein [Ramlibacter alkalitolerans]